MNEVPAGDGNDSPTEALAPRPRSEVAEGDVITRASLRRNVAQMGSSQVLTWTLATVSAIIIPRFLGPSNLGQLSLAMAVWGIVGVIAPFGTSLYLQRSLATNQRDGLAMVRPILAIRTFVFGASSLMLLMVGIAAQTRREFVLIVALAGMAVLFSLWGDVFGTVFIGLERMATPAVIGVVNRLALLVLTVAVLFAGARVIGILVVSVVTAAFSCVLLWRSYLRLDLPPPGGSRVRWRRIVVASAPFMFVTVAVTTYRQIDVIVIARVAGSRDLGWYSAADVLVGSLLFPTTILMASIFPTLGRLYATNRLAFQNHIAQTFSLLLLAAVPIGLGAMVVSPAFSRLIYGPQYEGTGAVLAIMSVMTMFTFGSTLFAYAALAAGHEIFVAVLIFAFAAVTVPLDLLLVPWAERRYDNGAIGGALAYVVTESAQFLILLVIVAPFLVTKRVAWKTARVVTAGLLMAAAVWPLRETFVLVSAGAGALVYTLLILVFRALNESERELAGEAFARLRRRADGRRP